MRRELSTPVRLAGFLVVAVVVFGLAAGIGRAVGPLDTETEEHGHGGGDSQGGEHAAHGDPAADLPGGLSASASGHTLRLASELAEAGEGREVAFTIEDADGEPVTDYDVVHEKELHLIAVRRDLTGFQHVHPTRDDDGTWRSELDLTPGTWRVFADFSAHGTPLTLGVDLQVSGAYEPATAVAEARTAEIDGYRVELAGELTPGADTELALRITKDGEPVTDLQPYLGAHGHLVALRAGDLAYLHVHPEDGDPGPEIRFHTNVPSAGRYHLFLDFRHADTVRTAEFTLTVDAARPAEESGRPAGDPPSPTDGDHHTDQQGEETHDDDHAH